MSVILFNQAMVPEKRLWLFIFRMYTFHIHITLHIKIALTGSQNF